MARQILRGLDHMHRLDEPLVHGDLRCDKIYVNGHSGEIKIGDLGLATLLPKRWAANGEPGGAAALDTASRPTPATDIFAFGLCVLELLTLKPLDSQHCDEWHERLAEVAARLPALEDELRSRFANIA